MNGKIPRAIRLPDKGYDVSRCPKCGARMRVADSDTDPARGWRKRWRRCRTCKKTYPTIELFMLPGRTGKLRPAGVVLKIKEEESEE